METSTFGADDADASAKVSKEPSNDHSVPAVELQRADGTSVAAPEAFGSERTLVVFLSPGCEACHDVAARVDAWREQLTGWHVRVMVPNSAADFAPEQYGPGVNPDLLDASLGFGSALAIETPALVTIEGGRITREPARSQGECYALIRQLRSATQG